MTDGSTHPYKEGYAHPSARKKCRTPTIHISTIFPPRSENMRTQGSWKTFLKRSRLCPKIGCQSDTFGPCRLTSGRNSTEPLRRWGFHPSLKRPTRFLIEKCRAPTIEILTPVFFGKNRSQKNRVLLRKLTLSEPDTFRSIQVKLPDWFMLPLAHGIEAVGWLTGRKFLLNVFSIKMITIHRVPVCSKSVAL